MFAAFQFILVIPWEVEGGVYINEFWLECNKSQERVSLGSPRFISGEYWNFLRAHQGDSQTGMNFILHEETLFN